MKNSLLSFAKLGLAAAALSLSVSGHANLLSNGDFENLATGWSFSNSTVNRSASGGQFAAGPGSGIFAPDNDFSSGAFTRNVNLSSASTYLLDFYVRTIEGSSFSFTFGGVAFDDLGTPDDEPFMADQFQLDANGDKVIGPNNQPIPTGWVLYSAVIQGFTGGEMSFEFSSSTRNTMAFLDDVSLVCSKNCDTSNDVPEPGSLMLVGAALAGLGIARRRRKA